MERKCLQGLVGSSPRLNCCCTIGMRGWRVHRSSHPCRPLWLGVCFLFHYPRDTYIYMPVGSPAVVPLENMLVVPGGANLGDMATCRRDLCSRSPSRAPTYSCCCNAGSLWDATDRVPIVGTFVLASMGLEDRTRLQRSGHIGPVAGASYDDRLYICSVAHGWRGHLERQRWRRVCIRWDSRDELRHRTR